MAFVTQKQYCARSFRGTRILVFSALLLSYCVEHWRREHSSFELIVFSKLDRVKHKSINATLLIYAFMLGIPMWLYLSEGYGSSYGEFPFGNSFTNTEKTLIFYSILACRK